MKQVKITDFFGKRSKEKAQDRDALNDENKRKRWSGEESTEPRFFGKSSNFVGAMEKTARGETSKRRKTGEVAKGKSKTDKENGDRKITSALTPTTASGPTRDRLVLSPKKLIENVSLPDRSAGNESSPKNDRIARDLDADFDVSALKFEAEDFDAEDSAVEVVGDADGETWRDAKSELIFDRPLRCVILRFAFRDRPTYEQALLVRADGSEKKGVCKLRDMWTFVAFEPFDVVTITAAEVGGEWIVDARRGYVVLHPDATVPTTSLVNSTYCMRRGILSESYKTSKSNPRFLLVGQFVHELLQESLRTKADTEKEVRDVLERLLKSKSYLHEFYKSDVKWEEVAAEVAQFVPRIMHFVDVYVKGERSPIGNNYRGKITEIVDIEEFLSSSKMGIRGRIDLTVKAETNGSSRIMPMELKTGRASFSREHKMQLTAYTLLLGEVARNVESGLLLYLRDDVVEEMKPKQDEIRDLFMLRNEFVRYAKDGPGGRLPEPIRSSSCSKCPHARICHAHLRHDGLDDLSPNHPIRELDFPDLKQSHVDYVISWTKMVSLEEKESKAVRNVKLEDLSLDADVVEMEGLYDHTFRRLGGIADDVFQFSVGSSAVVASEDGSVLERGRLTAATKESCSVAMSRRLNDFAGKYRIEIAAAFGYATAYLTNLAIFLEERYLRLRELVIDKARPVFREKIAKTILDENCANALRSLNREQQRAVLKTVASSKEYVIIRGPPGTGKTETIVAIVKLLHARGESVLIAGHTHSSVDNILLKLDGIEYLRLGSPRRAHEKVRPNCLMRSIENCETAEDVARLYERRVIASTCLGLDAELIDRLKFDACVIDESSQVLQAEAIRPLLFARKFVLIGDAEQLRPVVKSAEARKLGMSESIFERLATTSATVSLRLQYRMNRTINDLANGLAYAGALECGSDEVANATLRYADAERYASLEPWTREILSPEMEKSVVFADTSAYADANPGSGKSNSSNELEANLVAILAEEVVSCGGARAADVGVVAPYCDQVKLIGLRLSSLDGCEVSTVDQFQGRDKEVIFFSCTKQHRGEAIRDSEHLLDDRRRLTVAVTRAKVKLIVVGDAKSLKRYAPFRDFLECLRDHQIVRLGDGEKGFRWSQFCEPF